MKPTSEQVEKARNLMTEHVAEGCCCEKCNAIRILLAAGEPQEQSSHPPGVAEMEDLAIAGQADRQATYDAEYARAQARLQERHEGDPYAMFRGKEPQEQHEASADLVEAVRGLSLGDMSTVASSAYWLRGTVDATRKVCVHRDYPELEQWVKVVEDADPHDLQAAIEIVRAEREGQHEDG